MYMRIGCYIMALIRPVVARGILRTMKMSSGSKMPLIAGHKLLYECNLRCKMCPFWRREDEKLLDIDEEVKMMESLKRAGVSFLGFEWEKFVLFSGSCPRTRI